MVTITTDSSAQSRAECGHQLVTLEPFEQLKPTINSRFHSRTRPRSKFTLTSVFVFCSTVAAVALATYLTVLQLRHNSSHAYHEIPIDSAFTSYRQRDDPLWLDCDELSTVTDVTYLAGGWTKAVFTANYLPLGRAAEAEAETKTEAEAKTETEEAQSAQLQRLALKTLLQNGTQIQRCLLARRADQQTVDPAADYEFCFQKAKEKLLKEAFLLSQLSHPGIVRLHGYCNVKQHSQASANLDDVRREPDSIIVVTELGQPFNLLDLLQMSWTDRLKITISLLEILDYFAQKGLVLNDLRQSQFVLVDNELKLTDLDDINQVTGGGSPESYRLEKLDRANTSTIQLADKQNLQSAYRHFFKFILTHSPPRSLRRFTRSFTRSVSAQQYSSKFYAMLLRNTALDQVRRQPIPAPVPEALR